MQYGFIGKNAVLEKIRAAHESRIILGSKEEIYSLVGFHGISRRYICRQGDFFFGRRYFDRIWRGGNYLHNRKEKSTSDFIF